MNQFTKKAITIALATTLASVQAGQIIGEYKYNVYGEVTESIDVAGKASKVVGYNVFGQPTATIDRMGNVSHITYDGNGQPIANWIDRDPNNRTAPDVFTANNYLVTSQYDELGRTTKVEDINGTISYQYYPDGQQKSVSYQDKNAGNEQRSYDYHYDRALRQTSVQQYVNGVATYKTISTDMPTGQPLSVKVIDSAQSKMLLQTQYFNNDPLNPTRVTDSTQGYLDVNSGSWHTLDTHYSYDAMGKPSGISVTNEAGKLIYSEQYVFDNAGNMVSFTQDYGNGKKTISHYSYGILQGSNGAKQVLLTYRIDPQSTVMPKIKVVIDGKEQVVMMTGQDYDYTENWGIKKQLTYYKTDTGQTGSFDYQYSYYTDYPDRVKQIKDSTAPGTAGIFQYDNNGNVTQDQWGTRYLHNPLNQLEQLIPAQGTGKSAVAYTYNTSGMVNSSTPLASPAKAVQYHYLGGTLVAQTQMVDGQQATANYFGNATLYDPQHQKSNRINVTNYRSDVIASQQMNQSQLTQYDYSPYGIQSTVNEQHQNNDTVLNILNNIFGYTNQIFDPSAQGSMMGGKRIWDPKYAISYSHDTISVDNPYMTMRGNPMAYSDPSGNFNVGNFLAQLGAGFAAAGLVMLAGAAVAAALPSGGASLVALAATSAVAGGAGGLASTSTAARLDGKNWLEIMRHKGGWQSVAVGAVVGGIAAPVGGGIAGSSMSIGAKVATTVASDVAIGAAASAGQQGLNIATREQSSFDWAQFGIDTAINTGISLAMNSASEGVAAWKSRRAAAGEPALQAAAGEPALEEVDEGPQPPAVAEESSAAGACFVAGTVVWVRRRREDDSSRFLGEMFAQYDVVEIEVQGQMHEIILLPIELIEIGDEVLSMPEDYRPELDDKVA